MKKISITLALLLLPLAVLAQAVKLTDGEVRRVDKENAKINLKHGPIESLDMPAMSMVFRVKDASMLDKVKPGDKVQFAAEKINGEYTVIRMELAK